MSKEVVMSTKRRRKARSSVKIHPRSVLSTRSSGDGRVNLHQREIVSFDIPAASVGRTHTIRFALDGGGDGVEAVVDFDDLHFVPEPGGAFALAAGCVGLFALARRRDDRRERIR